ncbi:MAG: cytochrome c3 family protein [Deltaproteobacteria bacterium]|nr:cytochrome c3 family protein [Deltaproteobacteria bacterium]
MALAIVAGGALLLAPQALLGAERVAAATGKARTWLAPVAADRAPTPHAPHEPRDCRVCHERSDPKDPGPPREAIPSSCVACHEEVGSLAKAPRTKGKKRHPGPRAGCGLCHNPHNSAKLHLLL